MRGARRKRARRPRPGVASADEYAVPMDTVSVGGLVKVAVGGPDLDGIVFDVPSRSKVIVAIVDRDRGPVMRTVHPDALTERTDEGPDDRALQLLVRRTPQPARGNAGGGTSTGRGSRGHTRGTMHRTTGR
jgi:hypothetical protein